NLPMVENSRIVIITGTELRHDRFALRLQSEFPGLVAAWLQVVPASQDDELPRRRLRQLRHALFALAEGMPRILAPRSGRHAIIERIRKLCERARRHLTHILLPHGPSQLAVEQHLFADEIERLRKAAYIDPTIVQNPNSADVIASIR